MRRSRPAEPTAVFHERGVMEDAVRGLVNEGIISPQRIRISHGTIATGDRVRAAPENGSVLVTGLAIGAATGAMAALAWMYFMSSMVSIPLYLVVLRTVSAAAAGALVGSLLAVFAYAFQRKVRDEIPAMSGDFVVTVKPADETAANEAREFLAHHGGDLVRG